MEKYNEIFAFLFNQDNILYSLFLLAVIAFISGLVVFILSKTCSDRVKEQFLQEKKASENVCDELLISQKNDQKRIADLQHKLQQSTRSLMHSEKLQSEFKLMTEQLTKELLDIQTELDLQKEHLLDHSVNGHKIEEIEQEAIQLAKDLVIVKQQLKQQEDETNKKNMQIEAFETTGEFVAVEDSDKVTGLENTIQQNNQQLAQFNEKLHLILLQLQPGVEEVQNDETKGAGGILGKLLSFVSNHDNEVITDENKNSAVDSTLDVWQQHQKIIDQLINHLSVTIEAVVEDEVEQSEPIVNEESAKSDMPDLSEQVAEVMDETVEKVEQFQDKLKGFYQKILS